MPDTLQGRLSSSEEYPCLNDRERERELRDHFWRRIVQIEDFAKKVLHRLNKAEAEVGY